MGGALLAAGLMAGGGADAGQFAHVPPAAARANWHLAGAHAAAMRAEVWAWNPPAVAQAWERDCAWRREVWDKVDDVRYCRLPPTQTLRSLARLRELLGEAAFAAGRLPAPLPEYVR